MSSLGFHSIAKHTLGPVPSSPRQPAAAMKSDPPLAPVVESPSKPPARGSRFLRSKAATKEVASASAAPKKVRSASKPERKLTIRFRRPF